MEDNCFTILHWFLPYNNMNWLKYTYASSLSNLLPSPHPIWPLWVSREQLVELPVLYSNFPLAIYFTYGNVYVLMLLSQFIPLYPSPAVLTSLFPMSASLFLPWKYVVQYLFLDFVWSFVTPWAASHQTSLSITNFRSLFKLMSIESVMPSSHFILCRPLLPLPSIF